MKENIKQVFKPTLGKIVLTFALLSWQYFYSYQNIRLEFLSGFGEYITSSLSYFNWGNYFIQNISLFFVWILIAVIIFPIIWFIEIFSTGVHNLRIKRKYINQPGTDYLQLLKNKKGFLDYLRSRSLWIAGILIIIISLFALSDLFERMRYSILEGLMWNAFSAGATVDFYSTSYTIWSFVVFSLVWYLVSSLIFWVFMGQKVNEDEEKITKEHYAVSVDNSKNEEDS